MSRLEDQLAALERFYGLLPSPPHDPFRFFVWEVLSAQALPAKRDAAFAALKRARALTPDAMSRAPQAVLERAVALAGAYQEQRMRALRAGLQQFRRRPGLPAVVTGPVRAARRALKTLPQQSDGGAHRMLLFAADCLVLPVDARVRRVGTRLGYAAAAEGAARRPSLRRELTRQLPDDAAQLRRAFLYLSHHALTTCTDADPHCRVCPLLPECPEGKRRTLN